MAYLAGSLLAPVISRRVEPVTVVAVGLLVTALGYGLLTQVRPDEGLAVVLVATVAAGFGLAPVYALTTGMVVTAAPSERSGTASAVTETGAELGGALGIAALGSVSLLVYRNRVQGSLAGLGPEDHDRTLDTLAGALATADRLGGPAASALADAARTAFAQSFRVTEAVSATLMVAAAAGLVAVRRRVR